MSGAAEADAPFGPTAVRAVAGALAAAACLLAPVHAQAQLSGTNLVVGQYGNLPAVTPSNRTDLYDRLDLSYAQDRLVAGLRFERDRSSDDSPGRGHEAAYEAFTQRWLDWRGERLHVRAGNFHTILGRGLVHRSFELPGVVLDEPGSRSRYTPSRDVDGLLVEGGAGPLEARAFSGRPNGGDFSPASEALGLERYRGTLTGAQVASRLPGAGRVGAVMARHDYGAAPTRELGSGFAGIDPLAAAGVSAWSLPLYAEYAQSGQTFGDWWKMRRGREVQHALYASAALLRGRASLTAEFKDYDGFRTGFNDPPALVREHAAPLLNRNTHLLDAEGESGFQLEAVLPASAWGTLTANLSRSDGPPGLRLLRFEERYLELHVAPPASAAWEATVFVDRGFDTFDFVADRTVVGVAGTAPLTRGLSLAVDLERQRAVRHTFSVLVPDERYDDRVLSLTLAREGWGSVGFAAERTSDPQQQTSDDFGRLTSSHRWFSGVTLAADVNDMHQVSLFAGRRRGGRACNAGICYEVAPLEGGELRWTARY